MEQPNILTRNEKGEVVVYKDAIPGSNFKSLFKSMVSNQQNLNQVNIDEFLSALQSLGVKKYEISGEPLKIKYKNVPPYGSVQRHSKSVEYEHKKLDEAEDMEKEKVRPPSPKQPSQNPKAKSSCKKEKNLSTSHLDAHLTFFMLIN